MKKTSVRFADAAAELERLSKVSDSTFENGCRDIFIDSVLGKKRNAAESTKPGLG